MSASDTPENRPVTDSRESISARLPASEEAQLSAPNGVSISVSSVAIDRGLLNFAGTSPASAPVTMANSTVNPDAAVSDVDVMLRVKTGDESAFAYLVQKYRRPMVGFMYRLCRNPSTAEELAQEVFLRVYRSRTRYEPSAKFTTWLYRIATDLADESLSAEEQILKRERVAAIRSKVNALPERQRVAVIMHKYQQMDYREIAGVLKLSESATKSLLFRAYETLREQLKEFVSGKI